MAEIVDIKSAIGCLSTVYPQYVSQKLAEFTDQILTAVESFTDPFSALADLQLDSLIDDVASLSDTDAFTLAASVATGLTEQFVRRDGESILADNEEFASATKRAQDIRNLSNKVVSVSVSMMGTNSDMPYAAAQRMCEIIIQLANLRVKNLNCLRKHIVQVVNSVVTLANNTENYHDDTLDDLQDVSVRLGQVETELATSQVILDGNVVFDIEAFNRARAGMLEVSRLLTPDIDGTSILDVVDIVTFGSVEASQVDSDSARLIRLVIPSLANLLEVEASAYYSHVEVTNHQITSLLGTVTSFEESASSIRVATERSRTIQAMRDRIDKMHYAIDLAVERQSTTAASAQMLIWSSQTKAIIALMDKLKQLEFVPASDDALLESEFQTLLDDLTGLNNDVTVAGIEDPQPLRDAALSLSQMALRVMGDLEAGRATAGRMATLHAQALTLATSQVNRIDSSITLAQQQKTICQRYADLEIAGREQYDQTVSSMKVLGLDRAVDLLGTGRFTTFLESDVESLSYTGAAINCLTNAMNGIDDSRTRERLAEIRDDMVAAAKRHSPSPVASIATAPALNRVKTQGGPSA